MEDRVIIASELSGFIIPDFFVPAVAPRPVAPMSLQEKFGTEENDSEYWTVFNNYYVNAAWQTDDTEIVPEELRDAVADWEIVLLNYNSELVDWLVYYEIQKQVQWRYLLADAILD